MGLRAWRAAWQHRRAQHYLTVHPDLAQHVLRDLPEVALQAVEQAMLRLDAGSAPERSTVAFPSLTGLNPGSRWAQTLPKTTPFNLRRFSEYPPSRRAINAICNPILDLPWTIDRVPDPLGDPLPETIPDEQCTRMRAMTTLLQHPNPDESWRVWLEQVLEDVVIGGAGASEVAPTGDTTQPLRLWTVDGMSIRVNTGWDGTPSAMRYSQSIGYTGISVGRHDAVQLRDDQLLYIRLNPRSNTPFGLGYLESAFATVNAFIAAFDYATRRAANQTPNYVIFLGEHVDLATVRQWQAYWEQMVEGYGKAPILGGGRQPTVMPLSPGGEDTLFLKWQEFLIRVIAMAFGLSPMKLGLERDVNRNTAETMDAEDWETVAPVANCVADYLTHKLLHQTLGWPDLQFKWLLKDTDEKRQAEILQLQYETNSVTINELRATYQREPLKPEWGDLTKAQYEAKAKALEMQAGLPNPLGGPPDLEEEDAETRRRGDAEREDETDEGTL